MVLYPIISPTGIIMYTYDEPLTDLWFVGSINHNRWSYILADSISYPNEV